jgi:mRNA interferase MazF
MKRGDVVLVSGKGDYDKARPAVIVQADYLAEHLDSITVCLFTSDLVDDLSIRVDVSPTDGNGLKLQSQLMVDKMQTYPRKKVFGRIGELEEGVVREMDRALAFFLQLNQVLLPTPQRGAMGNA